LCDGGGVDGKRLARHSIRLIRLRARPVGLLCLLRGLLWLERLLILAAWELPLTLGVGRGAEIDEISSLLLLPRHPRLSRGRRRSMPRHRA